ncbi:ABC transporter ATP-binding protein [Nesterenkonia sp. HG001]|uniref:ABC transporter ATP-binding protein n=1 Tax=Nesterenkonia sp. HG001 TaxID=2983207 RepID=UPI002AC3BDD3|nr:ABC transporter ATP-binding protein [Nesterenkonia sp. HG001]MDZ5077263.1 ABC transporter ATP-binding protein [Nesterenkonia sp. HG001]
MIHYEDIEVSFGDFTAIPALNLDVAEGEFFTLLGPSGCGKTTALRALAGFVQPSRGEIFVEGRPVSRLPSDKRGVGMVFQNYALFPSMTVWENIAFGLRLRRHSAAERRELVAEVAERVDLSAEQLQKHPSELSGGQQQRVAIARALVLRPKILLLDEPLSNLDAKLRHQLRSQLKELQSEFGITTLYVTHDQDEALTMSDRIAVFNAGRIEQVGTPEEIYDHSANEFVCRFIGAATQLSGELAADLGHEVTSSCFLRLEKPLLETPGAPLPPVYRRISAVVQSLAYHGTHTIYTVEARGTALKILVREDGGGKAGPGDEVEVGVNPEHVLAYPSAGVS